MFSTLKVLSISLICFLLFTSVVSKEDLLKHPSTCQANTDSDKNMQALKKTVQCNCGKVKLAIDSPSVLRLVCYCKDCRGYYNTLNEHAATHNMKPAAELKDQWGGVDWTTFYPSEIKVLEGAGYLKTTIIRPESKVLRVHTTCCYTPMFTVGENSSMLNTKLISQDESELPDLRFRIMGRQALTGKDKSIKKPSISWSVPLSWPFVMIPRVQKDRMEPKPIDLSDVTVLEGFKQG